MVFIRYSSEQLLHLRNSPLVQRPEALPSIEQWMETPPESTANGRRKTQSGRGDDTTLPENPLQRPILSTRHSTRASQGDDIVLGPPLSSFSSTSRNQMRAYEVSDKDRPSSSAADTTSVNREHFRDKFSQERTRDRGAPLGQRRNRDEEGWSSQRGQRGGTAEESDRWGKLGETSREKVLKDRDGNEVPLRRNGIGRGKSDQAWREESGDGDTNRIPGRNQGWRDQKDRENVRDRDWTRGNRVDARFDDDPEWLNDGPKEEDKRQARTQEDFQKWKESMKSKITSPAAEEKQDPINAVQQAREDLTVSKAITPLALDPGFGKLFGTWDASTEAKPKTAQPAPRGPSKFMKMFGEKEAVVTEAPPTEPTSLLLGLNSSKEDQEGFQRILQLLGTSKAGNGPLLPATAVEPNPPSSAPEVSRTTNVGGERQHMDLLADVLARQGIGKEQSNASASRSITSNAGPISRFFPAGAPTKAASIESSPPPPAAETKTSLRNDTFSPAKSILLDSSQPPQDRDNRQFLLDLMKQTTQTREGLRNLNAAALDEPQQGQRMSSHNVGPMGLTSSIEKQSVDVDIFDSNDSKTRQQQHPRPSIPPGFSMEDHSMLNLQQRGPFDGLPIPPLPNNMGIPSQHMLPEWARKPGMMGLHQFPTGVPQQEGERHINQLGPPPPGLRVPPGFVGTQGPLPPNPPRGMLGGHGPAILPANMPQRSQLAPGGPNPGPVPISNMHPDLRHLPPPLHGPPPPGYYGMPPPPGPPGFMPRGHGPPDPRELLNMQQHMGPPPPGRQGMGLNHGHPNGFPGQEEMVRGGGRSAPPGFGGM